MFGQLISFLLFIFFLFFLNTNGGHKSLIQICRDIFTGQLFVLLKQSPKNNLQTDSTIKFGTKQNPYKPTDNDENRVDTWSIRDRVSSIEKEESGAETFRRNTNSLCSVLVLLFQLLDFIPGKSFKRKG